MELYDHLRKISFGFFVVIGLGHFIAGLMAVQGYYAKTSLLVNRALFIPFIVAALTYAFSNIRLHLLSAGKTAKTWDYAFLSIGIIVLVGLLAIEALLPDAANPFHP